MKPRPLFAGAVTLRATTLIFEGNGAPALYLCAETRNVQIKLYRVPEGCTAKVHAPRPLPPTLDGTKRVFLPSGCRAVFETSEGQSAALNLHSVRLCRELLEALEAYGQAVNAYGEGGKLLGKEGAA